MEILSILKHLPVWAELRLILAFAFVILRTGGLPCHINEYKKFPYPCTVEYKDKIFIMYEGKLDYILLSLLHTYSVLHSYFTKVPCSLLLCDVNYLFTFLVMIRNGLHGD